MAMTRVLVVDDSALMRRLLGGVLGEAGFVVETARNGAEGVAKVTEWEPDVVTLDINMPEMDGLTALSLMMEARPTPVVMVSSLTEKGAMSTFEALALGAVDYIAKPGGTISLSIQSVADELIRKVRTAAGSHMRARGSARPSAPASPVREERPRAQPRPVVKPVSPGLTSIDGVVLVGVSTGGPRTLEDILPKLPAGFPWPVVVAQHMPPNFTDAFARRMDRMCALNVREVAATAPLERGTVYIGKGGTDIVLVERLGRIAVQPRPESPEHPWHPSVDVMVQSAMRLLRPQQIVGVQLTGMGDDGADAMAELKRLGGRTIAEAESTAVVFGMPRELIEKNGATVVLPCDDVARQLCHWVR
jgi:two-component system, chemotaxis family, protein-glutamate methylesterase/glutaminase